MPSKKRKYNARFPAGRIKKIMQTDEEVGKVAQAVPIIIYPILCPPPRTLELFVESLLSKAMQVTMSRNAKTLSPSHVKQCILAESRFDFLRDLVKNIPDVSIAEEKEMLSAEDSPNSSRFSDVSGPPRRLARQDSSSSGGDLREAKPDAAADPRAADAPDPPDAPDAPDPRYDTVMDLSRKPEDAQPVVRTANFYQETLTVAADEPRGVITPNPTYAAPQPSTSSYANLTPVEPVPRVHIPPPKPDPKTVYLNRVRQSVTKPEPKTPVTPILNIDFTKDFAKPEIKVLDTAAASIVVLKSDATKQGGKRLNRQNSKAKPESKKSEAKPCSSQPRPLTDQYSGDLQIDEDYDT